MSTYVRRRTADRHVEREQCIECRHRHFLPVRHTRTVARRTKILGGYYEPCPKFNDGCGCSYGEGE
jgi:hypothetical protein